MKILIANKFYYNRGGDCTASIALEDLLQNKGHKTAFFSMQHPLNFQSEWNSYFPSNVDFQTKGIKNKIKAFNRILYSNEVKIKFSNLLDRFQPDVVHLNNIHSQLSPLIGEIAHQKGIKVVWTIHDYKLICPCYTCLNGNGICEDCIKKQNPIFVIKNKCLKNNLLASSIAYLEALAWNRKRLINNTDYFITPSSFMGKKMIEGGFPIDKVKIIPNFTNRTFPPQTNTIKKDYFCYIGRLSNEKGLNTLIRAAEQLPYKLIVVGTGPLLNKFRNNPNIEFTGFKEWHEFSYILEQAKFMVIPSEWYENNPISIIESLHLGTPILGANIGGIPEMICKYQNGLLFKSGNIPDLRDKIEQMFNMEFDYSAISQKAREKFSPDNFYNELIKLYNK